MKDLNCIINELIILCWNLEDLSEKSWVFGTWVMYVIWDKMVLNYTPTSSNFRIFLLKILIRFFVSSWYANFSFILPAIFISSSFFLCYLPELTLSIDNFCMCISFSRYENLSPFLWIPSKIHPKFLSKISSNFFQGLFQKSFRKFLNKISMHSWIVHFRVYSRKYCSIYFTNFFKDSVLFLTNNSFRKSCRILFSDPIYYFSKRYVSKSRKSCRTLFFRNFFNNFREIP